MASGTLSTRERRDDVSSSGTTRAGLRPVVDLMGGDIVKKHLFAVSLVLSLGLVATACGGGGGGGGTSPEPSVKGGVLRESLTDFGFTNAFDPTGEYLGSAWGYYAQMLIRGLVSYPFVSGAAGNEIQAEIGRAHV